MLKERRKERREYPRVRGDFRVEIAHHKSCVIADTINISASGIYCQSGHSIPLFREIGIRIKLPGFIEIIECSGAVVRCEKVPGKERYNTAIFFEDLSSKDKGRLSSYVHKKLGKTAE